MHIRTKSLVKFCRGVGMTEIEVVHVAKWSEKLGDGIDDALRPNMVLEHTFRQLCAYLDVPYSKLGAAIILTCTERDHPELLVLPSKEGNMSSTKTIADHLSREITRLNDELNRVDAENRKRTLAAATPLRDAREALELLRSQCIHAVVRVDHNVWEETIYTVCCDCGKPLAPSSLRSLSNVPRLPHNKQG